MSVNRRLPDFDRGEPVEIELEGRAVRGFSRETVAVSLFADDAAVLSRSLKYHRPRGFFCLEGHCGGCLMRIDGVPNLRACMADSAQGRKVEGQNAYPSPDLDVLGAVDWLFPKGMDHHTLMTGSRVLNSVVNKVVRQLSGLGQLPEHAAEQIPPARELELDVAIIGGGPAGLAAATAAAKAGAVVALFDEHRELGGCLLTDPRFGTGDAEARIQRALAAGASLNPRSTAIAFFPEDFGGILAVATDRDLVRVRARRYIYATGGYAVNRLFINNDRPGVLAGRAVGRLLVSYGVRAAQRVAVIGDDPYAAALADALTAAECKVLTLDDRERRVIGVRGKKRVKAIEWEEAGKRHKAACEIVAVCAEPSAASEAARQHGCRVELRGASGFVIVTDERGATNVPEVFACGDVCGYAGVSAAAKSGEIVGDHAAREALA
jgi:sarcosine oxidase subunit alpha